MVASVESSDSDIVINTARGTLVLLTGNVISIATLAISSIIVARLLGPAAYGLYVLALIPATFLAYFPRFGISNAATKYVATLRANGQTREVKELIFTSLIFMALLGLAFAILLVLSSSFVASNIMHRPYAGELVSFSSLLIVGMSLMQLSGGILVGLEKMHLYSVLLISQALCMIFLSVILITNSFGVAGAVLGNALSYVIAGGLGAAFVIKLRYLSNLRISFSSLSRNVKMILGFGIPVSMSNIMIGGIAQYQGYVLSRFVDNAAIGDFGAAYNFITFMTIMVLSITTSLLPAFSKIGSKLEAQRAFRLSIKYSVLLMVPLTLFIIASADKLVDLIYGEAYSSAGFFLALYAVLFLSTGLGYVILNSFFMGLGAPKFTAYVALVTLVTIAPLAWILTATYGVIGLILATVFGNFVGSIFGLGLARKVFGVKLPLDQYRIYLASLVSVIPLLTLDLIGDPIKVPLLSIIFYALIFCGIYLVALPLAGGLAFEDLRVLSAVVQNFQLIRPFMRIISRLESKLIALRS